jgi:hypothetical protein
MATDAAAPHGYSAQLVAAWALVGIPLAWGVWMTLQNALALFR